MVTETELRKAARGGAARDARGALSSHHRFLAIRRSTPRSGRMAAQAKATPPVHFKSPARTRVAFGKSSGASTYTAVSIRQSRLQYTAVGLISQPGRERVAKGWDWG